MRKNLGWAVVVLLAALIEATWLDAIRFRNVMPNLVLLLVIYYAITEGEERAMFTGLLGGLFQDVAGDAVLGHNVLCLAVVGYLTGRVASRLITDNPYVKAALVLAGALVHGCLFTTVTYVQNPEISAIYEIGASVIPRAFYTALLTPVVFVVLTWAKRRIHLPKEAPS